MAGNNGESSMEADTSQDGEGAAGELFDNYRKGDTAQSCPCIPR
jgi:hypothetical protein